MSFFILVTNVSLPSLFTILSK